MLTYRGDKFVKGKKFELNEGSYRFSKRNEDILIFESIKDKSVLKITEEQFNESVNLLTEKINQENKEINGIIGKVLRSKSLARKYEDELKKYGITVDYDQSQGVTLKGPNGKVLDATSKTVSGPSKPGFSGTHNKDRSYSDPEYYKKQAAEYKEKLAGLKALDRDDIIRKYNTLSTDEALAKHDEDLKRVEQWYNDSETRASEEAEKLLRHNQYAKRSRRAGHTVGPEYSEDKEMPKSEADEKVDYLTYLTKKHYDIPYRNYRDKSKSYFAGSNKQEHGRYYDAEYTGRNGYPSAVSKSDNIKQYNTLKRDYDDKKVTVERNNSGSSLSSPKTDEQLEKEIQAMRDDLEKRIQRLKDENEGRKKYASKDVEALEAKAKELDDFLKSKGIRESKSFAKSANKLLESCKATLKESFTEDDDPVDILMAVKEYYDRMGMEYEFWNDLLNQTDLSIDKLLDWYNSCE